MRKPALAASVVFALVAAACGGGEQSSPAATATFAELAAPPAPTLVEVPAPDRAPSVYRALFDAVEAGELDVVDADRVLMPMLFGDTSAIPAAYRAEGALLGVPDMALFWMLQRMQSYPPDVRAELEGWLPANRAVATAEPIGFVGAPRLGLVTPSPASPGAPGGAPASAPSAPLQEDCKPGTQGTFPQLAIGSVTGPDGYNIDVAICGPEGADAASVLSVATANLPTMMQFAKPIGGGTLLPQRRGVGQAPQIQIFLVDGQLQTPMGGDVSHGYMATCQDVAISVAGKQQCEIAATVRHELFHCLHMAALGYNSSTIPETQDPAQPIANSIAGKVPDWVSEGSAVWAEQRFGPDANGEWQFYQRLATQPTTTLELTDYPAGLFFEYLWQQQGNDEIVRQMLRTFVAGAGAPAGGGVGPYVDELPGLLSWPEAWYRFSDAIAGFDPLYEDGWGGTKLTDSPAFPYESTADCTGASVQIGQETIAPRSSLTMGQLALVEADVQGLGTQFNIVEVNVDAGIEFIDVGLAGDLADAVEADDHLKLTAIVKSNGGNKAWDWGERWRQRSQREPIKLGTNSMSFDETDGSFRVCLTDDTPECDEVPADEIYRNIDRITLIVSNAGTEGSPDDVTGAVALLPGGFPGWTARRVEIRDPAPDTDAPNGGETDAGHDVTGSLRIRVDPTDPELTFIADWVWFPRDEYPWDNIGSQDQSRPQIHPSILTGYVNYGCHFEGWVRWKYEELEVEVLDNDWVRRRLKLTRDDQGEFYNNDLKFKCELVTKHPKVNELLGTLVTMGEAPVGGFQSSLVQLTYMRVLDEINNLEATPGSFGELLYETFKGTMTAGAMDENVYEADLYFAPDGRTMEFEILDERAVVFRR